MKTKIIIPKYYNMYIPPIHLTDMPGLVNHYQNDGRKLHSLMAWHITSWCTQFPQNIKQNKFSKSVISVLYDGLPITLSLKHHYASFEYSDEEKKIHRDYVPRKCGQWLQYSPKLFFFLSLFFITVIITNFQGRVDN